MSHKTLYVADGAFRPWQLDQHARGDTTELIDQQTQDDQIDAICAGSMVFFLDGLCMVPDLDSICASSDALYLSIED